VVALLLKDSRVQVNAVTHHGDTALSIAAQEGHAKVIHALLADLRVDPNIKSDDGLTALAVRARQ